ncbi:hypothetical protein Arub01_22340 [Actinomadura rubrobrunea]|uniref:DUF397 domain-containing protein n=1 Tax=Actinomadura rubrobrunea TaxID=115335 RepID=A0A9W6PUF9_9ACTN|nr:DUF397 domain-containing protein [Actinomadura rubrobrunea]GLW63990.1 hypothetical protein Arub01_22340 [Actinomadura rubrobrunea]
MIQKGTQGMTDSVSSRVMWRTSSYSGDGGGQCVQVGKCGGMALVRDSKHPEGPVMALKAETWNAALDQIKRGEYDLD